MSWESCLKEHIRRVSKDENRAKELLKMAELRHSFWSENDFNKKCVSLVVDGYYEVIKELLTAMLYLEGLKSDNHECLISFLKEKYPEWYYEVDIIYQLKRIRNNITYRGFFVKPEYLNKNQLEFDHIIKTLKKVIQKKLSQG